MGIGYQLIVDKLNQKQHRGCAEYRLTFGKGDNPMITGDDHTPKLTMTEWEAIAFYVPPKTKPLGGELIRHNLDQFTYRNLRCEVWESHNGQWHGQHLDTSANCHWHPVNPAPSKDEVRIQVEAAVNAFLKAEADRKRHDKSH